MRELPRLFPSPKRFGVAFYDPSYYIPAQEDVNPDYNSLTSVIDSIQRWCAPSLLLLLRRCATRPSHCTNAWHFYSDVTPGDWLEDGGAHSASGASLHAPPVCLHSRA